MTSNFHQVPQNASVQPQPFEISTEESSIEEFQTLLNLSKVGSPTYENNLTDRSLGISAKWLAEAKDRWLNGFSWRACEERFNRYPNFKMPVEDEDGHEYEIHFIALFSNKPGAIPVVMLHGWPGSFIEFLDMLTLFAADYTPETLPYHLIVPSLPGYAYSTAPPLDRDLRVEDVARVINKLMLNLGFGSGYVCQGGDIGSKICRVMAAEHVACKAAHLNFMIMPEPAGVNPATINDLEKQGLERAKWFHDLGSAYALQQATKPSTIGLVLASNPLALLAWIGEKFLDWTDEDPELDVILEAVALYWFTETFPKAIYPYRQLFTPGNVGAHENPIWHIKKPFGFSWFPKEIAPIPRSWAATTGNMVFYRQHTKGGHFAALERPEILKDDLVAFIDQVWTT